MLWFWGLPGNRDQGQLLPEFFQGPPGMSYKDLAATYAGLGSGQVGPSCTPRLTAASAGPGVT